MARQPDIGDAFVDQFLETGEATPQDLDALITARIRETLRLELKGG